MSKDQSKFDSSCHDTNSETSLKNTYLYFLIYLKTIFMIKMNTLTCIQGVESYKVGVHF